MVKVLINADDLGLHPAVTRAVETLSLNGKLHSASVMANGAYVSDALRLKNSILLGAHLNVLRGKPLSKPDDVSSLLNAEGYFLGSYMALYKRYILRQLNLIEVKKEWNAQIVFLKNMGLELAHIDSEKHTHVWPRLMRIACELAEEHHIPRVRFPYEYPTPLLVSAGALRTCLLRFWLRSAPKEFAHKFTISRVWGLENQGGLLNDIAFKSYLNEHASDSVFELVCHPGHPHVLDPPLDPSYGKTRVDALWMPEFQALLQQDFCTTK